MAVDLVSGEAVHLDVRLARAGSRVLALLIDAVSQVALYVVTLIGVELALSVIPGMDAARAQAGGIIALAFVLVGYPTLIHTITRGRSLGKLAMGLRVVRDDGGPITLRHAFTRALVGAVLEWPGILLPVSWLVSLGTLLGSPRAKRVADLAAGTIVIHERTPEGWGWVPTTPAPLMAWASTLDLTGLNDELALAARHFLARSRTIREPYRSRLGEALAREMLTVTTPPPPPGTPGWAYLAGVIGERHRRAAHRMVRNRSTYAKLWPELFPTAPLPQPTPPPPTQATTELRPAVPS